MPDDKKNRGPADRARINVHESWEVQWWCRKFGCTKAELEAAVKAVGVSARAVEAYMRDCQ